MKGWACLDVRGRLQKATFHLDLTRFRAHRVHAFGVDSVLRLPGKNRSSQGLSAFYALQKLAERDLEGGRQRRQVAETNLAHTSLKVRYVNLVNTRLFGKVNLPPTPFLSELSDSFAKLDANIRSHSSSIDLVEALYLVDALSRHKRYGDEQALPLPDDGRAMPALIDTVRADGNDAALRYRFYDEFFNQRQTPLSVMLCQRWDKR